MFPLLLPKLLLLLFLLLLKKKKRLKALATEKFKAKLFPEAIKYYNDAGNAIYPKGDDSDPTRLDYYVILQIQCGSVLHQYE